MAKFKCDTCGKAFEDSAYKPDCCSWECYSTWHDPFYHEDPFEAELRAKEERETKKKKNRLAKIIEHQKNLDKDDAIMNQLRGTNPSSATNPVQIIAPVETKLPAADRAHAEFGGSGLSNIRKCPHFRQDQSGDKSAAERGTFLHDCAEHEKFDGLEDFEIEAVKKCIKMKHIWSKGAEVYQEIKIEFLDQWGYVDCVFIYNGGTEARVIDYKFGKWDVEAPETNLQGWAYALGVWNQFPNVNKIKVNFLLPFVYGSTGQQGKVTEAEFTRNTHYPLFAQTIANIIAKARDESSPYSSGQHCTFCSKKSICPKLGEKAVVVATKYADLQLPKEFHSSQITDPEQMSLALQLATVLEGWAKSVKSHAKMLVQEGKEIPGYELVTRSGAREITDAAAAFDIVKDVISAEEMLKIVSIPISDFEELYASKAPKGQKKTWKEELSCKLLDANLLKVGTPTVYVSKTKTNNK